ncbi:MAG: hypothetical protein AB1401_00845 [Thermodesulfobacteriota bacterium]
MEFVPKQEKEKAQDVPYFDDVTSEGGWQGQSTSKSLETLKAEIVSAVGRLGGLVTGFQQGMFMVGDKEREGYRMLYVIEQPNGNMIRGRMDIAALPVKQTYSLRRSLETRKERSLKMALYMLRNALEGTWFLQQLSPGYAPLMPWILTYTKDGDKTITQLWSESATLGKLLPPGESEFIEGVLLEEGTE